MKTLSRKLFVFLTVFSMLFNNIAMASYAEENIETVTEEVAETVTEEPEITSASAEDADEILSEPIVEETQNEENAAEAAAEEEAVQNAEEQIEILNIDVVETASNDGNSAASEYKDGDVISVTDLSKLAAGNYTLNASLSCYVSAMGGVEFGAPLLEKAILTIAKDGNASITLDMGTSTVTIFGITANTYICDKYINANGEEITGVTGYYDGTGWKDATYTKDSNQYIDKITFPITETNETYKLAMLLGSDVMGKQFGNGENYDAVLTIDWSKVTVGGEFSEDGNESGDDNQKPTEIASGTCGDNLTWVLGNDYVLTISGTGAIPDMEYIDQPWAEYAGIKSVVIGDGVTSIGKNSFMMCDLSSVTIGSSVTSIGDSAFLFCASLKEIEFPKSLEKIGANAFNTCSELKKITFNGSAPIVGSYPFSGVKATCYYPAGDDSWSTVITGTSFGKELTWTANNGSGDTDGDKDQDADKDTTGIASGKFGENLTWVLDSKGVLTISGKGTMPDSGYGKQPWASYTSQIKSVVIGNEVTSVGGWVFMLMDSLSSVTIGNSVTSIGDNAFAKCTALKEIEFPKSLTKMGSYVFTDCKGLEKITFKGSAPTVGTNPFGNISATCYYPTGDDSWSTVITGKSFGENLTWTADDMKPDYKDGDVISVADLSKLTAGNYTLDASLSCYVNAMGGVEFGAPLLEGAILTVAEDGSASITLDMGTSSVTIYTVTANTYIDATGVTGYYDGSAWQNADYTKNIHNYVDKITFPITKANGTYALAMKVGSDVMGTQFGGEAGKYNATLTIDWTKTLVGGKLAEEVHSWDNGTVTEAATCTKPGVKTYKCSCGVTNTETIAAAGHTEGAWKVAKAATCTAAGSKVQTCAVCGDTLKTETIKAKGHSYGTWTTVSEATVLAAKTQKHTCTNCNASETQSVGSKLTPVLEVAGKLSSISMKKGSSKSFTVTMANGDSVKSVTSSAVKIVKASLDSKTGKITLNALKKGSAKVTISLISGKSRTYTVKVTTATVKTTGISAVSVTNNKLTLKAGKTHTLKTELKPFTSTQKVTYSSSNKKVATVTSAGKIKAVAAGKATITAKSGSKSVKITVTVPGISISQKSVTVKKGKTRNLSAKIYGISEKVMYTSSNTKTATVTASGKIKGIKKGTAKITIKAGSYTKTVTVKVK